MALEEYPRIPMEKTRKIIRRSVHTFLQHYHYLTTTAALLALPYSASALLSQAFVPSSSSTLLPTLYFRLKALFQAAGFPPSSQFFSLLSLKISQTISSSVFALPFTLSFLLLAKASVIHFLNRHKHPSLPSFSSFISLYQPLLITYLCNSLLLLSANATAFTILFFAFNLLEEFGFSSPNFFFIFSAAGAVLYSIIIANALIICNLALVLSGMEGSGGCLAILKAFVLIRGRTSTGLSLAVPVNLVMAAIEALFHFRIVRAFHFSGKVTPDMGLEGMLIAFLYSMLVVLDTVVSCIFFKSCKNDSLMEEEGRFYYRTEIAREDEDEHLQLKNIEEIP
ncbi:hypothetical protein SLE2022_291020 [Rubroshorea leprosula]